MVYRSKKDAWLVALVWAAIITPLIMSLYHFWAEGRGSHAGWAALLGGVTTGAVVLWLTYPLDYEVTATMLKVRCGVLIRRQIRLSEIEEVHPTRNPASAPAWSLDRLQVSYRRGGVSGWVLISPAERDGFLRELVGRAAGLELRGNRVVRTA